MSYTPITLKNKQYKLVFNYASIEEWETLTSLNFVTNSSSLVGSIKGTPTLLFCALQTHHKSEFKTVQQIEKLIAADLKSLLEIAKALNTEINRCFLGTDSEPQEDEESQEKKEV